MTQKVAEAAALLSVIGGLGATASNGTNKTHLSGVDKDQLEKIQDILRTTMFGNLWNSSAEDQAEVNSDHNALLGCDTNRQGALNGSLAVELRSLNQSRSDHKACRLQQETAIADAQKAADDYQGLLQSIPKPPPCPTYTKTLAGMEMYFDSQKNAMKKYYEVVGAKFRKIEAEHGSRSQAQHTTKSRCDASQGDLEQRHCSYGAGLRSVCATYNTCHTDKLAKYEATAARVRKTEADRKNMYKSGIAVICHLDVILGAGENKTHDKCVDHVVQGHKVTDLDIKYPTAPNKSLCDASAFLRSPCDPAWIADEYSPWMPAGVQAAACKRCNWESPPPAPAPAPLDVPAAPLP